MSEISNNNRHFLLYTLKWMSIYISIGFIAAFIIAIPCISDRSNRRSYAT